MKGLLIHSLVVTPIIRWITSPHRSWPRKVGVNLAILALIVIAFLQLKRVEVNCFDLLEVDTLATNSDISKAFRRASIKYHPDTLIGTSIPYGFPSGDALFIELQKCSDILSSQVKRDYYNRFGNMGLNFSNESMVLSVMGTFSLISYLVSFVVCMVLTASRESQAGRWWIVTYLVFAFASELQMRYFKNVALFAWMPYVGYRQVYEQIQILKDLIPSVLSSALLLSQFTYQNEMVVVNQVLEIVNKSNKEIAIFVNQKGPATTVPVPAVLQAMAPPKPPSGGKQGETADPAVGPKIFSLARLFQILFWAYVTKMLYNMFVR